MSPCLTKANRQRVLVLTRQVLVAVDLGHVRLERIAVNERLIVPRHDRGFRNVHEVLRGRLRIALLGIAASASSGSLGVSPNPTGRAGARFFVALATSGAAAFLGFRALAMGPLLMLEAPPCCQRIWNEQDAMLAARGYAQDDERSPPSPARDRQRGPGGRKPAGLRVADIGFDDMPLSPE